MSDLETRFGVPPEIQAFIDSGLLEVLSENDAEKTIRFHIPALRQNDERGRITAFSLTWIHPDFNAQFCHFYDQIPGDLTNFYLNKENSELGDDSIDLADLDDLLCWLDEAKSHI